MAYLGNRGELCALEGVVCISELPQRHHEHSHHGFQRVVEDTVLNASKQDVHGCEWKRLQIIKYNIFIVPYSQSGLWRCTSYVSRPL